MGKQNSLTILANPSTQIEFGPYTIEVTPIEVGELPVLLEAVTPAWSGLERLSALETLDELQAVGMVMGTNGAAILQAISIMARLPLEQVNQLTPDLAAELLVKLLKVNADFFAPRMRAMMERIRPEVQGFKASLASNPEETASAG